MVACLPKPDVKELKYKPYYDIQGLMDRQIHLLDSINPPFMKMVKVNGKEEIFQGKIVGGEWKGELQIMQGYDLNKPTLFDKYKISESTDSSNLIITYISKFPETTRVDTLCFTFDKMSKNLRTIHVHAHSSNTLFESGQVVDSEFSDIDNRTIINSYRIDGWQKLLSNKATNYSIAAQLDLP